MVDDARRRRRKKRSRAAAMNAIPARDPIVMPAIAPLERWLLELGVGEGRLEGRLEEEDGDDEDVAYK